MSFGRGAFSFKYQFLWLPDLILFYDILNAIEEELGPIIFVCLTEEVFDVIPLVQRV